MRNKILLILLLLPILLCSFVSAEIMLNQPKAVYNLGDNFDVSATFQPSADTSGFTELNLECGDNIVNFYKEYTTLEAGQDKKITTSFSLTNSFLGEAKGSCVISGKFGNDSVAGQEFKISDKIDIGLVIVNANVEAGEEIPISGTAKKENGENANGFVEVNVEDTGISIKREVTDGKFGTTLSFPSNTKSGKYILSVKAYEKYGNEETNYGNALTELNVQQTPKIIRIDGDVYVSPGEDFEFTPALYDQADDKIAEKLDVKVYDSNQKLILEKAIESGATEVMHTNQNSTPGYWRVDANFSGLSTEKTVNINELEKADFQITNNSLKITNVGNVVYNKPVEISIGGTTLVKNIELAVGEAMDFLLYAPEGKYDVLVSNGKDNIKQTGVSLTGSSIGVMEAGKGSVFTKYPLVWLFLICIFALLIFVMSKNVINRDVFSYPIMRSTVTKASEKKPMKIVTPINEVDVFPSNRILEAENSLVLKGRKENVGMVGIRIRNMEAAKSACKETMQKISEIVASKKGAMYKSPEYLIALFSSATTKSFQNDFTAVDASQEIYNLLKEHNRKFKDRIDYGMSVNLGELILGGATPTNKLMFTHVGNGMAMTKKIADLAKEEVLLSSLMSVRVSSRVKTAKEEREGIPVYQIKRVVDRDMHSKFIDGFMKRQKEGR